MENATILYFVKSGISLALFYLLFWAILRKEKTFQFNRIYLITSVIISYLVPIVNFSNLFSAEVVSSLQGVQIQNIINSNADFQSTLFNRNIPSQQAEFDIFAFIMYFYFAVVLILLIRLLLGIIRVKIIQKHGKTRKFEGYSIVETNDNIAPFSFFSYIFINKSKIDVGNFDQVIEHEKSHIKQQHSFDILILNIASIIQWFNPFVWLTMRGLKEIHEYLADEKVIAQGYDSASYSTLLIHQIADAKAMDLANCFNNSLIKKRIIMLNKLKSKLAPIKSAFIIPLFLAIIISISCDKINEKIKIQSNKFTRFTTNGVTYTYDSLMTMKSPSFDVAQMQAINLIVENAILPSTENDEKNFSYQIYLRFDNQFCKFDFEIKKFKTPAKWIGNSVGEWEKTVTMEKILVQNYSEVMSELPKVSDYEWQKIKNDTGYKLYDENRKLVNFKEIKYYSVENINLFRNHLNHWGYAAK